MVDAITSVVLLHFISNEGCSYVNDGYEYLLPH